MWMPRIPQGIEHALGQAGDGRVGRVVAEEEDVHVAVQADEPPAVAADGDEGHPRALGPGLHTGRRARSAAQGPEQAVEDARVLAGDLHPGLAPTCRGRQLVPVGTEVVVADRTEAGGEVAEVNRRGGGCRRHRTPGV